MASFELHKLIDTVESLGNPAMGGRVTVDDSRPDRNTKKNEGCVGQQSLSVVEILATKMQRLYLTRCQSKP